MYSPGNYSVNRTPHRTPKNKIAVDNNVDWIEIINHLQNKLTSSGYTLDISLPQIVVVGCQSAGKSSVLESIVGKEFLPRGSGVVTRRPTVVQLDKSDEEYAVFLHKPDKEFKDFNLVRKEIESETFRVPGPEGFSSVPISLKIFTPNALKLTLVDLPGLIRVTVDNQSEDSIQEVRNMVLQYIRQPNSLILAVSPANQDIANSDALEIAKTVDPQRVRTIGVLTKLDLMDEGTDARVILENEKIPLKRGYIGVLNRSQQDIVEGKDFDYCLKKEKDFFQSKPCYKHMADVMGTPYLKKFLHKQLYNHIKESLPAVRHELTQKLGTFQKILRDCNSQFGYNLNGNQNIQSCIIRLVQRFVDKIHADIFGGNEEISTEGLTSGAIINFKLFNVQKNLKHPEIPDEKELIMSIANLGGVRNGISLPSLALEAVAKKIFSQYQDPLNDLVDSTTDSLLSSVEKCSDTMDSYPSLKSEVLHCIYKYIHDAVFATKDVIEKYLNAAMYFVNTYHPDFDFPECKSTENLFPLSIWEDSFLLSVSKEGVEKASDVLSQNVTSVNCENSEAAGTVCSNSCAKGNASYLSKIIEKYIQVQQNNIGDIAVKYVTLYLVKAVMDFIKKELIPLVIESADQDSIKEECEKDFNKIKELTEMCECLEEALAAIHTF